MTPLSYPARQRNRRLARGAQEAAAAVATLVLAGVAASSRIWSLPLALLILSVAFALRAWRSAQLARRSSIGARSEERVRAELKALEREGWQVRHSLRWRGRGDIDHVAVAPSAVGLAFAIETKTRSYGHGDLDRIAAISQWLGRRRASGPRRSAVPVLCLAGRWQVERWERGVTVVSAERLAPVLRRLAGTTAKPGFLR
jgi:hypothetical protein